MNNLSHLAFIMDGNNRWSKKNNRSLFDGYKEGAYNLINLSNYLFKNNYLNCISAFALSKNNLNRSKLKISTLRKVLIFFLDNVEKHKKNNFKILFKGNLDFLSMKEIKKIKLIQSLNKTSKYTLQIYINYSGQYDIYKTSKKFLNRNKFTFESFKKNLSNNNYPEPEILIRTGGYSRLSDFMLFEIAFTELFFIKKLWPDLNKKDIYNIIKKYRLIERKFGG